MEISWQWGKLESLSQLALVEMFKLRQDVFIVEQNCIYPDIDGLDEDAQHLLGWAKEDGKPLLAAYARVLAPNVKFPEPALGRVLVRQNYRQLGMGRKLVAESLERVYTAYPDLTIRISAQEYLINFYASFGFQSVSEVYLEDGIPHIEMIKTA
ncbi:GNAT family N-acetyltransferase [Alteromonas pelagimontana]|uniref:GNAT family N-acetyltransferase n=1 Tax=Alteromonas pelagimontana TaxID=1858656 RepID=A0A6M4MDY3_9ALTE|nr:GNAT family N-acetyltransferase [Alteromonas pelagimontana]QJR80805.1 GNAT family N-acetyltransferase [Alteromonas pelagimontana]